MMRFKKTQAFTLIELLVVISIIALLIAILLPALSQARATAQSAQCLSQIKQMGIITAAYANDYDGFVPLARIDSLVSGSGNNYANNWQWQMNPYAGYPARGVSGVVPFNLPGFAPLYMDPAAPDAADDVLHGSTIWQIPTNYRYNSQMGAVGLAAWEYSSANPTKETAPRKLARFMRPSEVVQVADGSLRLGRVNPRTGVLTPNVNPFFGSNVKVNGQLDLGRHSGAENYLFIDGHAATQKIDTMDDEQFRFVMPSAGDRYYR